MFMFVFAMVVMGLAGLFLQIVLALNAFIAASQIGMGQQMMIWHAMAYEYVCSASPTDGALNASAIEATRDFGSGTTYTGYRWSSNLFTGTIDGVSAHLLVTYMLPTETAGGYSAPAIYGQLEKVRQRGNLLYGFGTVTAAQTVVFFSFEDGVRVTKTYGGLPPAAVPDSVALVSDASC